MNNINTNKKDYLIIFAIYFTTITTTFLVIAN